MEIENGLAFPLGLNYEYIQKELIRVKSRLDPFILLLSKVAMVTDDRMDVEHIVTENGVVNLRGLSTAERARALISIAHPQFRDELTAAARKVVLI